MIQTGDACAKARQSFKLQLQERRRHAALHAGRQPLNLPAGVHHLAQSTEVKAQRSKLVTKLGTEVGTELGIELGFIADLSVHTFTHVRPWACVVELGAASASVVLHGVMRCNCVTPAHWHLL